MQIFSLTRRDWLKTSVALGLAGGGSFISPVRSQAQQPAENKPLDIGSRREMFVDDHLIDGLNGRAALRLHQPVPRETALVHDVPWEGTGSGYHTVIQDGDRYRLYYRGWHLDVADGKLSTSRHPPYTCYAESDDGIHWTRPELGLVEHDGSKQNNIIVAGLGTHNFSPFLDANPDCPPEARYKALAGVKSEGGLFAFQSADGVRWALVRKEPVITNGAFDSQNLGFWDPTIGRYRAYWRYFTEGTTTKEKWQPAGYRAIRTAVSDDFLNWKDEADLAYVDSPAEQLYTNQVTVYRRAPHILLGFPSRYLDRGWSAAMRALPERENRELRAAANRRYGTALTEGLLMAGRDGVRFKRWNEAFLRPGIGRSGTWQYGQNYIACNLVETASTLPGAPNELSLYATEGYWHGAGATLRRYTLRLDGFVSAYAPMAGGALTTKPLTFTGSRLKVNFATSAAGSLRVELQDAGGRPIDGFGLTDCPDHFGDDIEYTVTWKDQPDLARLNGRPVRLRFHLQDADLYAFRFEA